MIFAMQNETCIWDTSLNAGEDEKEFIAEYIFFILAECFLSLFPVINRLTAVAAAAVIAENIK
jgi:hypothetical protein